MKPRILVIGGGIGGISAAISLAADGFQVDLFEKNERLGGKLNLLEFAMGSGVVSGFGPSRNPWDPARTPSGSSSGSGTALAAHMVPLSAVWARRGAAMPPRQKRRIAP